MKFIYKRSNEEKTKSVPQPKLEIENSENLPSVKDTGQEFEDCDPATALVEDELNDNRKCDPPETDIDNEAKVLDWQHPAFHIEVDRDYSGITSTEIRFSTVFPKQLNGSVSVVVKHNLIYIINTFGFIKICKVPQEVFTNTIEGINALFDDAERVSWGTTLESILWYSTCRLMGCCFKTRFENVRIFLKTPPFISHVNVKNINCSFFVI